MKENGRKLQKIEDRLKVFGTKAGLLLCVAAIGLNLAWPIIATENTVPSITATTLDIKTLRTSTTTSPLNTTIVGGNHTYFQSPTEPCGSPKKPDQKVSPFNTDLRKLLCIKISHIAKIFGTELSRKATEQIAKRIVIVSKNYAEEICGSSNVSGCYITPIDMTILARFSEPPLASVILHEWLHRISAHLKGSHYLSEKTGICYRKNSNGEFFMTYQNSDGIASKLNIPDEMASSIFEQLLLTQQGSKTNPAYLTEGEIDRPLNEAFSRLGENYLANPSNSDLSLVFSDKPITMETFFNSLEQLIGDQADIVFLTEHLSRHLPTTVTDNRFTYIPAEASQVSPTKACGK